MVAGAGAMMEAARAMGRAQRQMDRYMRERAARRRARQKGGSKIEELEPLRSDFECYHLCGDCGFVDPTKADACPGCGNRNWLDLTDEKIADSVRDMENVDRHRTPGWIKGVTLLTSFVLFGAIAAVVILMLPAYTWHTLLAAMVAIPMGYFFGHRGMAVLLIRWAKRQRPYRWRMPLPMPDSTSTALEEVKGVAASEAEPLKAPFSGRPCLAYQVCVLFDTPGDARPAEWVLQEAAGVDFKVGDKSISGNQAFVESPMQIVTPEETKAAGLNLWKFLRQRGLFAFDGEFDLFETRVEPGDEVTARIGADNQAVLIAGKPVA